MGVQRPSSELPAGAPTGPGPLSLLLQELARAPEASLRSAWKDGPLPGDRIGRFRILERIGTGGFGAVYRAHDDHLGRDVALKVLRPRRSGQELSADPLKREAEAIARLDHPCIVTLFDVGTSERGPFIVMELLRGETLAERLAFGPLPPVQALRVAEQVARGLAHAHERGTLHRDLKPANVFLCEDGRVKLLDFGLANLLGTEGPHGAGTPGYMPPEQEREDEIDARADVFAAAITLRETLAGSRRPMGARLPGAVAHLLDRAASPNREDRPSDGAAWLEEVVAAKAAIEHPRALRRVAALVLVGLALGVGAVYALAEVVGHGSRAVAGLVLIALTVAVGVTYALARARRLNAPAAETDGPSIAVLPFVDMSPGNDQEYFSDGFAEEVLNGLAQVSGLRVVGRTSSFSFRGKERRSEDIGRQLRVGTVLQGTVQRTDDRVRVAAQLVRVSDGSHLWARTFDRALAGVCAVQTEIAAAVVEALRVRLVPGRTVARSGGTTHPEALNQYLLGRDLLRSATPEHRRRALDAFDKAVTLDPRFAQAWVGIATALFWNQDSTTPLEDRQRPLAAAERAIALAPDLPDGYVARGRIRLGFLFDWRGGRADLERARSLGPNDAWAATLLGASMVILGDPAHAVAEGERAVVLDPLHVQAWGNLGIARMSAGDFPGSRIALARASAISPGSDWPRELLVANLVADGRAREALAEAGKATTSDLRLFVLAMGEGDVASPREAREALEACLRERAASDAYGIARIHAWRGERDETFSWLERALARRDGSIWWIRCDPLLRKVRGDPRFAELLRRMNLPVEWE